MKEIPLTQGKVAWVDDEDYERLLTRTWHAHKSKRNKADVWYVRHTIALGNNKFKTLHMHREILGVTDLMIEVDHIDNNPLNNVRSNLRQCTQKQNKANRRPSPGRRFKGVSLYKRNGKWKAYIGHPMKHLGYFKTEEEAARIYDIWARKLWGEYAHLNFPDEELAKAA